MGIIVFYGASHIEQRNASKETIATTNTKVQSLSVYGSHLSHLKNKNVNRSHCSVTYQTCRMLPELSIIFIFAADQNTSDLANRMQEQSVFLHKVATLRPHNETFVEMLTEAKQKVRALSPEDNRVYVYK